MEGALTYTTESRLKRVAVAKCVINTCTGGSSFVRESILPRDCPAAVQFTVGRTPSQMADEASCATSVQIRWVSNQSFMITCTHHSVQPIRTLSMAHGYFQ